MEVAIYFENGNVAYFKEVKDLEEVMDSDDVEWLTFNYFGISSQKRKEATFQLGKLAGYTFSTI